MLFEINEYNNTQFLETQEKNTIKLPACFLCNTVIKIVHTWNFTVLFDKKKCIVLLIDVN